MTAVRRAGLHGLLLALCVLACARILAHGGWPQNHDGVACFQKVEVFRRAFARGDVLPLWTPLAENGYGSPFPLFYHRLFNSLAGAVALATGTTAAVRIVIPLLLFVGTLGMHGLLRAAALGPFYALGGAVLLAFSNYAYTDWLVRGAFGEFAGFMLLPWLARAALGVVRGERGAGWKLGSLLALLYFAHSTLFLFAFVLVVVALAVALLLGRNPRATLLDLGRAAAVVLPVTGPFVLGVLLFGQDLDLDRLRSGMFSVFRNFAPLSDYVYDDVGGWTSSTSGYTVEIGRGFNTVCLVAFAAVLSGLARRTLPLGRLRENFAAWGLAVGMGVAFLVLQSPLSAPLYRLAPPVQFLQFPWRLLAFSTLASILVLCLSLDVLESATSASGRWSLRAAMALAVLFQVFYGVGRPLPDAWFSERELEESLTTERLARATVFSGAFRPRGVPLPPPRPFLEPAGCVLEVVLPAEAASGLADVPEVRLAVRAEPGGTLVINRFASPFVRVDADAAARLGTTAWGAILVRLPPGRSEIVLRRVGLLAALSDRLFGSRP